MRHELAQAEAWAAAGHAIALARVIAAEGSAPRPVGSAMVISSTGAFVGSVSGGCVEGAVIATAEDVIRAGDAQTLHFRGDADPLTEIALGCGGTATIFIERINGADGAILPALARLRQELERDAACSLVTALGAQPSHWLFGADGARLAGGVAPAPNMDLFAQPFAARPQLVIVGADAVGQAVAQLAAAMEWRVTVIDPRAAWLTPSRFPDATRRTGWPDEALAQMDLDADSAIVVLSHDPKIDEPALLAALRSEAGYVGALGSRTTHAERAHRLLHAGLRASDLARLHAPIGLDLGGHAPHEMALSVIAEIVAARNGRSGGMLRHAQGPIHDLADSAICAVKAEAES